MLPLLPYTCTCSPIPTHLVAIGLCSIAYNNDQKLFPYLCCYYDFN